MMTLTREEVMELIRKNMEKTMDEYRRIIVEDYYTVRRDPLGRVVDDEIPKRIR